MTTDNLEATLIDDSCFADIFTMQSQTLNDFEFGLEANNIDNLLELFEEREKRSVDSYLSNTLLINNISNNIESKANKSVTVTLKRENNNESIIISSPKVRKSTTNSSAETSTKSKGISLLAKPKKSNAKRSIINMNDSDSHSSSFSFPRDHDYCLISHDNLFNKLPDYITNFKSVSQEDCFLNIQQTDTFDKIPNYIKGYFNFNDDININEDLFLSESDDNILIELNEAYIEVSDVFFDDKITSNELNKIEDNSVDDSNSMSDSSTYSNTTSVESEDTERLKEIIENEQLLPQEIEQKDYKNNNNNNVEKKQISRKSRSRSREPRTKSYSNSSTRRRRISTRSSVDSSSQSSRSSSCSSSCSSYTSYSSRSDNESKINYKISNSIVMRNDNNKGQQFANKRTLKESYCQNNYQRSKIRPNFGNKNFNEIVNNRRNNTNNNNSKAKPPINLKQDIEQRKIIYVGKIPDGTTKTDIRHWFGRFGAIKEVSIHFRDYGDNYAFVTFYRRCDAYEAIEHANEDSRHPKFDLSFGGRRQFCKRRYEDLDYAEDDASFNSERMDFDSLLRSTQAKINR